MYLSSISNRLLLHDCSIWSNIKLSRSRPGYDDLIRDLQWSDDGKYMLQVNPKGLLEILTVNDSEIRTLQHIPTKETSAGCFHRDGHKNVAVGTRSGSVHIWDTRQKSTIKSFPIPTNPSRVNFMSFNAKNTNIAASMQNGETIIYGLKTNSILQTVKVPGSNSVSAMKYHPECWSLLGIATDESQLLIKDLATNKDKAFFKNIHASPVSDFIFSLIHRDVLISVGLDKMMYIYDIRMGNKVSQLRTAYPLTAVDMNLENTVAIGTKKGSILVYDLRDYSTPVSVIIDHKTEVKKVAFQQIKKKNSSDISIKEDSVQLSPKSVKSPQGAAALPDIFCPCPSPPSREHTVLTNKNITQNDSFLLMMGLDQSNNNSHIQNSNEICESPKNTKREKTLNNNLDSPWVNEHIKTKSSTPLNVKINGIAPSPIISETNRAKENIMQNGNPALNEEDLKNFIELSNADVMEDNRKCYYSIMVALTKQKLFMEDSFAALNKQVAELQNAQEELMEQNKRLLIEVEYLKATKY